MALSATEIDRVLREIAPVLTQGRIQNIYQPGEQVLVFEIRVPGETHRLLLSCEAQTTRLHLLSHSLSNPVSPPVFCQLLRAQLRGGRLDAIRQFEHDRIVTLSVSTRQGPRTLVAELMGHKANLLLLDERGHVLGNLIGQRELVKRPYEAPAQRRSNPPEQRVPRFDARTAAARFPLSQAIEAHYQDTAHALALDRAKHERLRALRKSLARTLRRIDAWRQDLSKAAAYRDYARYGELLKANLPSITTGMAHVTVVDYYDPSLPDVTLPLDATKSGLQNMNEYFKKHRKHLAAEQELQPRIAGAEHEIDALRREIRSIESGSAAPMPATAASSPKRTAFPLGQGHRRKGPFRRFMSVDGLPIFVGRSAQENEELTFRFAKSEDLWLHARGAPGSHVVVRLPKGAEPPQETLRDAATLALFYSDLKKSGKGEVIYTRRKWVKAAKTKSSGTVLVTQEQSIYVHVDRTRLDALKARTETDPGTI